MAMADASSPTAKAGCLHEVASRADRVRVAAMLESLGVELAGGQETPIAPDRPHPGQGPCTGAACSGMPGVPPAEPVGAYEARAETWASLTILNHLLASISSALPDRSSGPLPILLPESIFHPPRRSSLGV